MTNCRLRHNVIQGWCAILLIVAITGLTACNPLVMGDPNEPAPSVFERQVRATLKDPESAKFSGELTYKQPNGTYVMCGLVSAKNSFGGYTGNSHFIAGEDLVLIRQPGYDEAFDALETKLCKHTLEDLTPSSDLASVSAAASL